MYLSSYRKETDVCEIKREACGIKEERKGKHEWEVNMRMKGNLLNLCKRKSLEAERGETATTFFGVPPLWKGDKWILTLSLYFLNQNENSSKLSQVLNTCFKTTVAL